MNFETCKSAYDRDGFVIVRQFLSPGDFAELNHELARYIRQVVPTLPDKHAFYDDKSRPETLKQLQHMDVDPFFREYYQHPVWTALAKALVGEIKTTGGEVRVRGVITHIKSFREALEKHRFGYVSEDRKQEGLILLHAVRANTSITIWRRLRSFGQWITRSKEDAAILPALRQLDVRAHSLSQSVGTLSGGNQQKVSIAKWLAAKAEILIIDEPTVGIDIKTKSALPDLIWDLAANGKSILLISSDMPEVIRLSDRILVMRNHAIVGELPNTHQYDEMSEAIMARLS